MLGTRVRPVVAANISAFPELRTVRIDSVCNFIGNERWLEKLESVFQGEFLTRRPIPWITEDSQEVVGTVRSAGGHGFTAGNVTFVVVHEAGYDSSG